MEEKKQGWTLPGMCFNVTNPNQPTDGAISFPATQNVKMPGSKLHAGQAVDANVAAFFINNFYSYYSLTVQDDPTKADVGKADNPEFLDAEHQTIEAKHSALKQQHQALKAHHAILKNIGDSLVHMTYGMTLDKDLILNVLGQQDCEGIRFYLCSREVEDQKMHLSLVAVGVDKDGYDLNYNNVPTDSIKQLMAGVDDIPTMSVTVEYTTPPPPIGDDGNASNLVAIDDIDEHFALLKLARKNQSPDYKANNVIGFL